MGLWGKSTSAESRPKFLGGDGAQGAGGAKEDAFATTKGWALRPGTAASGNDNTSADPEVLVALGDLSAALIHRNAYSNATRGVFHSGYQYPASPNFMNVIQYITIATLGNTTDFGDSLTGGFGCGGSSPTRGVTGGGYFAGAPTGETAGFTNIIDFVEIATTGNAKDFGDLTNTVRHIKGDSNGHGGL